MALAERPGGDGDPVAGFAFYLRREREAATRTVEAYLYWLDRFIGWTRDNEISLLRATPRDIRAFATSNGWARKTRSQILSSLKAFYRYAELDGYIGRSPAEAVPHPRLFNTVPPRYDEPQARRLVGGVGPDLIDRMIVALGLFAGLRTGEGVGLEFPDVDLRQGLLHVRRSYNEPTTKNRRERILPLHDHVARLVSELKATPQGDGRIIGLTTGECYRKRFRRSCERADVPYYGPHALRRTFADQLRRGGVREGVVRTLLGHAKRTEDMYMAVTGDEVQQAVASLSYSMAP